MEQYEELEAIGRGSYGEILLVSRKSDGKKFVKKKILMRDLSEKEISEAMNEVNVLKLLQHENVISYHHYFLEKVEPTPLPEPLTDELEEFKEREEGILNIVMDYADGGDLHQEILKARDKSTRFSEEVINEEFKEYHRDLKAKNLFMTKDNKIKIGDFGISKILSSGSALAQTMIGTPFYLSPEICEDKPYDQKTDIWSFGCILYELMTLKHPFDAKSVPALVLKILKGTYSPLPTSYSQELRNIVAEMLSINPKSRPSSAESAKKFEEAISKRKHHGAAIHNKSKTLQSKTKRASSIPPSPRTPKSTQSQNQKRVKHESPTSSIPKQSAKHESPTSSISKQSVKHESPTSSISKQSLKHESPSSSISKQVENDKKPVQEKPASFQRPVIAKLNLAALQQDTDGSRPSSARSLSKKPSQNNIRAPLSARSSLHKRSSENSPSPVTHRTPYPLSARPASARPSVRKSHELFPLPPPRPSSALPSPRTADRMTIKQRMEAYQESLWSSPEWIEKHNRIMQQRRSLQSSKERIKSQRSLEAKQRFQYVVERKQQEKIRKDITDQLELEQLQLRQEYLKRKALLKQESNKELKEHETNFKKGLKQVKSKISKNDQPFSGMNSPLSESTNSLATNE